MMLLLLTSYNIKAVTAQAETNNAGKLVSYFLRDILGGIVGLKASQGNTQEAANSLKQVLHGMAGIVETTLEEQQTRGLHITVEEFEQIINYLQTIIKQSLSTEEGRDAFDLFLKELKHIAEENK